MKRRKARQFARQDWAIKATYIRARRIRVTPVHVWDTSGSVITMHSRDPSHCVCNGTHLPYWCPQCVHLLLPKDRERS